MTIPASSITGTGPQTEDGYTRTANELFDAIIRTRIPGEERQQFDFILRKTFGFNKKMDVISLSQFVAATGVKRQNVHSSLKSLSSKKMIVIQKDDNGLIKYGINKHYQEWEPSFKRITASSKEMTTVIQKDSELSSKKIPTKDTLTKDNKILSDFFEKLWQAFPKKDGKKSAERHYFATVKNDTDMERINLALGNYLHHIETNRIELKFIKNGSTWFNNWQDWEVVMDRETSDYWS